MHEEFLTIEELALRWKKKVQAIYWMRSRGQGPEAVRVGRTLRWRLSDVTAWEERQAASDRRR